MADKKCHVMLTVEKVKDLGKELPVDESALTDLLNILKHGCNDNFDLCFEVIRVLRNTATKKSSQSFLLNDEANFVSWFLTVSANPIFSSEDEIGRKSRQFLWQFFYNVSVGQELFQTFSWMSDAFKDVFFSTLEHSDDAQLKNVLFGLAYLRVKQENSVSIFDGNSEERNVFLLKSMISEILQDNDFALLCVQELASVKSSDVGVMNLYNNLDQPTKSVFLDVVAELGSSTGPEIVRECSKKLQEKARHIMTASNAKSSTHDSSKSVPEDANETRKLLNCLGIFSSLDQSENQVLLQKDRSLLIDCVYLLRMIHELGKSETPNPWTPARKLNDMNRDDCDIGDPVFGFKRDLIRLIGNLCHKHKENQDLVRETEGVQLLLDCSAADGKNPFITQWVVFAIRNLFLGNPENQAILREMDTKGKVDKNLLAQAGIDLQ